jgi:membrane associated rhomboid family serine protease
LILTRWLIHTDSGLLLRIAVGVAVLAVLAIADWKRSGRAATHWREYGVLLAAAAAAILYGIINDQITCSISWEYFYYGKALEAVLGPATPPNPIALHLEAAKVGAEATWSTGLIFGVVLLLANNPRPGLPQLRNRELLRLLPLIVLVTAVTGAALGICGYQGWLTGFDSDFGDMVRADVFHPRRFMCAWGVHLGGYAGGALGTVIAALRVTWLRQKRR